MIRGYFSTMGGGRRPFLSAVIQFPTLNQRLEIPLLVDTGADRTILSPRDARQMSRRLGFDLTSLPRGAPGAGVGGQTNTRIIDAILVLDNFSVPLTLSILEPPPGPPSPIPSLLGRDVLSQFALFMEEHTGRLLLLDPQEASSLNLPS